MNQKVAEETLEQMKDYYRTRASEYDEWFYRKGRYDRGEEINSRWFAEAEVVETALDNLQIRGDVLEFAPGTGIWTEKLVRTATTVTAVDASPEMVEINRAKVSSPKVSYVLADLFQWQPDRQYDAVFFGFWLSHVPLERIDEFFGMVAKALRPGGKLFFVDSRREVTSTAADHVLPEATSQVMTRRLNDGREFQIVKNFFEPGYLTEHFAKAGLKVTVLETPSFFIYGMGTRAGRII
jgi:demethylmenaquinone methyltransferase/2-methoxy-6-polyprenyl-1,4-benzoquinol methylase